MTLLKNFEDLQPGTKIIIHFIENGFKKQSRIIFQSIKHTPKNEISYFNADADNVETVPVITFKLEDTKQFKHFNNEYEQFYENLLGYNLV